MQADALAAKSKGLVGIGVDLTRRVDGAYEVSSVAGGGGGGLIHAGLVVLSVGGVTVFGMEEIEVAALIKGEHGTTVTLEVVTPPGY
jgi:C-terminal processing protease CtpA/Prc